MTNYLHDTPPVNPELLPILKVVYPLCANDFQRWSMYLLNRPMAEQGEGAYFTVKRQVEWLKKEYEHKLKQQ